MASTLGFGGCLRFLPLLPLNGFPHPKEPKPVEFADYSG